MKTRSKELSPVQRFTFWAIVGLMAIWILLLGANSFFNTWKLQRKVQVMEQQTQQLKAQNDSLAQENERLKTDPETAEKAAREKYGLTKDGETVFRFVPAKEDDTKK